MKLWGAWFGVVLAIVSGRASAQAPIEMVKCVGYNANLKGTVEHTAEIYADHAVFDGQYYSLKSTPSEFALNGPLIAQLTVGQMLSGATSRITIDRLDGHYLILDARIGAQKSVDWSRPEDKGCFAVRQLF